MALLLRAARRQGLQRFAPALQQTAVGEAALQQSLAGSGAGAACCSSSGRGQQAAGFSSAAAAVSWQPFGPARQLRQQQQQQRGLSVLSGWQPPACMPRTQQQQFGQQQHCLFEQRRGMAMKVSGFRPKRRDDRMPDRHLPARNEQIRAREVRVRFPDERPSEVLSMPEALKLGKEMGLDVVMVSAKADPPVVRLVEWSKVLYEQQKKEKSAAKQRLAAQRLSAAKEVRVSCTIAQHDLETKMGQARRFLEQGHQLRLVVPFKGGREIALGREVVLYLIGQLSDLCAVRDEKHLQKPMRNHWAVLLAPHAAPAAAAPPHPTSKPSSGRQHAAGAGGNSSGGVGGQPAGPAEVAGLEDGAEQEQLAGQSAPAAAA